MAIDPEADVANIALQMRLAGHFDDLTANAEHFWAAVKDAMKYKSPNRAKLSAGKRQVQPAHIYVSTNQQEATTVEAAMKYLSDPALNELRGMLSSHPSTEEAKTGIGVWEDGGEASVAAKMKSLADAMRLGAAASMRWKQKAFALFAHHDDGDDLHHTVFLPAHTIAAAKDKVEQAGFTHMTLIPEQHGTTVHLIDPGGVFAGNAQRIEGAVNHQIAKGTSYFPSQEQFESLLA